MSRRARRLMALLLPLSALMFADASVSAQRAPGEAPAGASPGGAQAPAVVTLTHGLATGDVDATSAVVWTRTSAPSRVHVRVWPAAAAKPELERRAVAEASPAHDLTARVRVEGLEPGTRYQVEVWPEGWPSSGLRGQLVTAPAADQAAPVRMAWSGDLGGQNLCRGVADGYPIFKPLLTERLDLFIALGDMIYADNLCKAQGRFKRPQHPGPSHKATTLEQYWDVWRYNREDALHQAFLAQTSIYAMWDDHEVFNNFGPSTDRRADPPYEAQRAMMPIGRRAFLDYNPIWPRAGHDHEPTRLYKSARWGKHVELFFLDTRQHRDPNAWADRADRPKTMLGQAQRAWLAHALKRSDATWKLVISSVPIAIPTGHSRITPGADGWSGAGTGTGFRRELTSLWLELAQADVRGMIWLTTDVHFAAIFAYEPFRRAHPSFQVHELVAGPMSAMLFPIHAYDRSLGARRLWMYSPRSSRAVRSFAQALSWMNYGRVEVDEAGRLTVSYVNGLGKLVKQLTLEPPQADPAKPTKRVKPAKGAKIAKGAKLVKAPKTKRPKALGP